MHRKLLIFITVLSFSSSVFSQITSTFTAKGEIQSDWDHFIFANMLRIDPKTGNFTGAIGDKDVYFKSSPRDFIVRNIPKFQDQMIVTVVDSQNEFGKIILPSNDLEENSQVDLGDITLEKLHSIRGRVSFPKLADEKSQKTLVVDIGYNVGQKMFPVARTVVDDQKNFWVKLPNGDYTFLFYYENYEKIDLHGPSNTQNLIKDYVQRAQIVSVKDNDVILAEPVDLVSPIKKLVVDKTPLDSFLQRFDLRSLAETKIVRSVDTNEVRDKVVVVYFFVDYCVPCFSSQGLKKYFDLAVKFPELSVIGVTSDWYEAESTPKSLNEMKEKMTTVPKWKSVKQKYELAQYDNSNIFLLWQSPQLSKDLGLEGYPVIFIFKNGVMLRAFTAPEGDTTKLVETILRTD